MNEPVKLNLELTLDEINGIINVLSELPIKTNAILLIQKIQSQAQVQLPNEEN